MTPTEGLPRGWYRFLGIYRLPADNLTLDTCYEMHNKMYHLIVYNREQLNF